MLLFKWKLILWTILLYCSNNHKNYFSDNGCDNTHSYVLYNSNNKECINECSLRNYYLISTSKFCIEKCDKVNLIEKMENVFVHQVI